MDGPVFDAMLKTALMEALEEDLKDLDTVPAKRPSVRQRRPDAPNAGRSLALCRILAHGEEPANREPSGRKRRPVPLAVGGGDCGHPGRHSGQLCASGRRIFPSDV